MCLLNRDIKYNQVGQWKASQAFFKCHDVAGISPGSPYIQLRPAEIPFSIQLLKIQEPCPPFHMVTLTLWSLTCGLFLLTSQKIA